MRTIKWFVSLFVCSLFIASAAHAWPGLVMIKKDALYWGQYKNVYGVIGVTSAADLATTIREYPLAGITAVVLRAQQPGQPFFAKDGAAIDETARQRMEQDIDTVNTLEMLPIVVLFDTDASCELKNAKAYANAAATFQKAFGKDRYYLLCVSDRCDDAAWKKGLDIARNAVKAVREVDPRQMVAAGGGKPETNEQLLAGDAPVNAIVAYTAEAGAVASRVPGAVIEVLAAEALAGDALAKAVKRSQEEPRYGFAFDRMDASNRTEVLGRVFATVDAYQKATYPGSAPDPNDTASLKPGEKEEGFASLFNGKDLTGWIQITAPNDYIVQDGAMKLVGKAGGWLRSWNVYKDYTLRLEFRIEPKGNNGIYNRCGPLGRQSRMGFELQVFGDPADLAPSKESCGAIYDVRPPDGNFIKPGEWNAYEVTCQGDDIKIVLNGHLVHQVKYGDFDALKPRSRQGFIGLQDHHNTVEYRNVRIKTLN